MQKIYQVPIVRDYNENICDFIDRVTNTANDLISQNNRIININYNSSTNIRYKNIEITVAIITSEKEVL